MRNVKSMQSKFYTQFDVTDPLLDRSDRFSGIVELTHERGYKVSAAQLTWLLAENFDIEYDQLELVNWYRLH
ncbi:MAG: hypothetical protein AAFQ62_09975 [Pseudomonadota bacterium]